MQVYTVKPLNNRHIGSKELVCCWEVVRISEVAIGGHAPQWRTLEAWLTVNCTWKSRAKSSSERSKKKKDPLNVVVAENSGQYHALRKRLGVAVRSRRWFCMTSGRSGANGLSVVRRSEVVRTSEVGNTLYIYGDNGSCHGLCPHLGVSVIRGFTVI